MHSKEEINKIIFGMKDKLEEIDRRLHIIENYDIGEILMDVAKIKSNVGDLEREVWY